MQNETRDLAYDQAFQTARLPPLTFGSGSLSEVATIAARFGRSALLVTGQRSFQSAQPLLQDLDRAGVSYTHVVISGEPSPDQVDSAVTRNPDAEMVIAIGGGAAVDAGKAISAMLPLQAPVKRYLEGVGDREPPGLKVPYIACPTTAGTGAEVTKNLSDAVCVGSMSLTLTPISSWKMCSPVHAAQAHGLSQGMYPMTYTTAASYAARK